MTPTKIRVLEAAVELLGTEGLRALTHARVDEQVGLPKGSTSNYFRSRAQLVTGVSSWISERELAEADQMAAAAHSPADLVEILAGGIDFLTGPNRTMTAARLTLFMEANHNADIRTAISQTRAVMERSIITAGPAWRRRPLRRRPCPDGLLRGDHPAPHRPTRRHRRPPPAPTCGERRPPVTRWEDRQAVGPALHMMSSHLLTEKERRSR